MDWINRLMRASLIRVFQNIHNKINLRSFIFDLYWNHNTIFVFWHSVSSRNVDFLYFFSAEKRIKHRIHSRIDRWDVSKAQTYLLCDYQTDTVCIYRLSKNNRDPFESKLCARTFARIWRQIGKGDREICRVVLFDKI